jgi:O-antigen ligase
MRDEILGKTTVTKPKNKKRRNAAQAAKIAPPTEAVDKPQADSENPSLLRAIRQEPLALGIAAFIFARPWTDGLTFFSFNLYYLWFLIGLTALWGARQLMRGQTIRGITPMSLLLLFLFVTLLTGLDTVQIDKTYRYMLYWSGHALLFFLCLNCLRTRAATGLVLGAFVATSLVNGMYALFHFQYMLPIMRKSVEDPAVLQQFFGMDMSAELRYRLEINRAFGNHLFPNALAAYLIMVLGCTVGLLKPALAAWRQPPAAAPGNSPTPFAVGAFAWLISVLAGIMFLLKPAAILWQSMTDTQFMILGLAIVIITPLIIATLGALATTTLGYSWLRSRVNLCVLLATLACSLLALWLSFSRGGMIALAGAVVVCIVLYRWGSKMGPAFAKSLTAATALLIMATLVAGETGFAQESVNDTTAMPTVASPSNPGAIGKIDLSASDLGDTRTLNVRVTYWKVALLMIRDNFWAGVGLGNFGTVYPRYQYLGAGNVQAAHNDYLQIFCETGVFGILAFCLFWGYFALWGARRIVREKKPNERWLLCGLYGGTLAFLVHALVDFNFYNPSLTAIEFFMAGVFFARAYAGDTQKAGNEKKLWKRQAIALPALILVALLMGTSTRVFFIDFARASGSTLSRIRYIDDQTSTRQRMQIRDFFLNEIPQRMAAKQQLRPITVTSVLPLIPDIALMRSFGKILVPDGGESYRQVALTEAIPFDAVFFITDPQKAREAAMEQSETWVQTMELTDTIYPYISEHALSISDWYETLQQNATDPDDQRRYTLGAVRWAEEGVERSPQQPHARRWLGDAYIRQGSTIEFGESQLEYYRRGIQEFRIARDLHPSSDAEWNQLGRLLLQMSDVFMRSFRVYAEEGLTEQADRMLAERDNLLSEGLVALAESARLTNGGVLPKITAPN